MFSQFTRFLDLVREALAQAGIAHLHLDGGTPAEEREARVAAFQRGEAVRPHLVARRRHGLNLTRPTTSFTSNPWWNPAVEDQATDRAHRIGQRKAVTVVRLVARGTVEEAVLSLHSDKRGLAASVLDGSDAVGRLDTGELIALLRASRPEGEGEGAAVEAEEASEAGASATEAGPGESGESAPGAEMAPTLDLGMVDALINLALAPYAARDGTRVNSTHGSYRRSLLEFRRWLVEARVDLAAGLDACIDGYLAALTSGAWQASKSAYSLAKITLGHLHRVARPA